MKSRLFKIIIALTALLMCTPLALAQRDEKEPEQEQEQEAKSTPTMAADPAVVVTVCLESGNITVRGSDRSNVHATVEDETAVTLRRMENPKATTPATRLEVVVAGSEKSFPQFNECRGTSDLELEVPRGATVYVKTREGDIDISDVAEVRADTSSGTITVQRVARAVEATSVDGDITLEASNGRIRLHTFSGSIEAVNAKMVEPNDFLYAKTTSGDVRLEQIAQPHVEVSTISGEVSLSGPLARGGFYDFKSMSGDITLNMPASVSFQVTAKVSQGGEVVTDFPLKYTGEANTSSTSVYAISAGKIAGTYGTGTPSTINLVSFSGTLRLHKM